MFFVTTDSGSVYLIAMAVVVVKLDMTTSNEELGVINKICYFIYQLSAQLFRSLIAKEW
jgi:hypothetical protein